jgi:UDPglucose 6-dehydrogenase
LDYGIDFAEGLRNAEFVYICTDTPVDMNDESDLTPIFALAENIGRNLKSDIVICVTAQVPIGTSQELLTVIQKNALDCGCKVAYIPEFLRLGTAVETFREADRFVIGCNDSAVAERVADLYRPLGRPLVFTDIRSAEMAKHASNAFLSTSISFINEIANLCEVLDADATEVARILKLDKRIGKYAFLSPGLGFAGGTLGREIRALQKLGLVHQMPTLMMDAVWQINAQRVQLVNRRLSSVLGGLDGHQIGILGLTYKTGTSTMRRAISLDIIRALIKQGATVKAFDRLANLSETNDLPLMQMCVDPFETALGSSALVLVTEWNGFSDMDFKQLKAKMRGDVFIDTRNLLDPARIAEAGFRYFGIGR